MRYSGSASFGAGPSYGAGALPPNNGMQLTCEKRHALCKSRERRARRFRHAPDARR